MPRKRFSIAYRLRYQNKSATNQDANETMRFKVGLDYNIRKWKLDPNLSVEVFNKLGATYNKYRVTLATDYKIKKVGEIKVFYRYIEELNEAFPKTTHVAGLSFIHTLKF